jgi:hypothetical protein
MVAVFREVDFAAPSDDQGKLGHNHSDDDGSTCHRSVPGIGADS